MFKDLNMKLINIIVALTLVSIFQLTTILQAQSTSELLPPEIRSEVKNALSGTLNGLVIFGSASTIGSGYFSFEQTDSADTKLDVLRLFNEYSLAEKDEKYSPFINFGIGQVKLSEQISPLEGNGDNDFSRINTFSVGAGLGVDIALSENFYLTPVFDFIYSHSQNDYDFNNEFSQTILALFDKNVFNWDVETLSYNPGLKARYEIKTDSAKIIPSVSYTQIYIDSISTNSDIIDVSTTSGVLNSRIRVEIPDLLCFNEIPLTLIPQFSRTDLYKDARSGTGIKNFHEVSLALLAKDQQFLPIFKDIGISAGYSFGEDITGWRVGLEGGF